jgi:hypothetical protein
MAIKSVDEMVVENKIDLTGPQGNAFCLLAVVKSLCKQLGKDYEEISKRMKSSDYENLIEVFDSEFSDYVTLYR